MKPKITVDWEELRNAFEFQSDEHQAVLDLETGKVRYYYESGEGEGDPSDIEEHELDENPDRYVSIEPPESHEAFRWMERFAYGQRDEKIKNELLFALGGSRPFRRFKDALGGFPDLPEDWYACEEECLIQYIAGWVDLLPVELVSPPAWLRDESAPEEAETDAPEFASSPSGRKLSWRDVCLGCRRYARSDQLVDDHPLTRSMGLTEGDLCRLNREDQQDSGEDFQCGAFESKEEH